MSIKKKNKMIVFLLLSIVIFMPFCQDRPHVNLLDPANESNRTLKIVEVDTARTKINQVCIDTSSFYRNIYTLRFEGDIPDCQPGDVLIDKSGRGMLYLIVEKKSIEKSAGIEAMAIQATLDFLLMNKEISIVTPANRTKNEVDFAGKMVSSPKNIELSYGDVHNGIDMSILNKSFVLDFSGTEIIGASTGNTNFSVILEDGRITYTPAVDFYVKYGSRKVNFAELVKNIYDSVNPFGGTTAVLREIGKFEHIKLITYTDLDIDLSVRIHTEGHVPVLNKNIVLAKSYILVSAGPIIFSIETSLVFRANVNIDVKSDFTLGYREKNNVMMGIEGDGPVDISFRPKFYHDFKKVRECDPVKAEGKVNLYEKLSIVPRIEVYLYGIIGASGEVIPYQDLAVNARAVNDSFDWDAKLGLGLDGDISLDLSAFHFEELTTELYSPQDFQFIYYDLYSAPHLKYISGNNQNGSTGQKLSNPFRVKAVDNFGNDLSLPVNIYWDVTEGGGKLDYDNTIYLPSSGSAQNYLTLGEHLGNNKATAYLKKAEGSTYDNQIFTATANQISNTPPYASFNVQPGTGNVNSQFSFDASGCTDNEDPVSSIKVRWDWENDGIWDTNYSTTKTAVHKYTSGGTYTILLEVMDTGGLKDTATRIVTVIENGSVKGCVEDASTNNPIEGATVRLKQDGITKYITSSLSDGTYSIYNIVPGTYTLKGSKSGYQDDSYSVIVGNGEKLTGKDLALRSKEENTNTPPVACFETVEVIDPVANLCRFSARCSYDREDRFEELQFNWIGVLFNGIDGWYESYSTGWTYDYEYTDAGGPNKFIRLKVKDTDGNISTYDAF